MADSIMEKQKQKKSGAGQGSSGSDQPAVIDQKILQRPSGALKSNIIKKDPEPCGQGMYRGGDGQCYPALH
jgi:hypothetical protein